MQVWVDVYDASGNRLGDGPVLSVVNAEFNRRLDGAGSWSLRCVGTDPRALTLLQNERRVKVWIEDTGGARLGGEGIIRTRSLSESPAGVTLRVGGPDILDELKRANSLLARVYNQATVQDVADDLIGLVSGWSVDVDVAIAADVIDARYDGVSVLKAFQDITKRYGLHLRASSSASKTLEIGAFGDDTGLRIFKVERINQEALANPALLMVQAISKEDDSEDMYNWLLPLGAGEGTAALTLEKSTRTSPYSINTVIGPDGTTLYYISDSAAAATYGTIQKVGQFKEVAPLSNSETDIEHAANALYDAAVEDLARHKDPVERWKTTVKNVKSTIRTGDKIHVYYKAQIQTATGPVDYYDVRGDYWVMSAVERVQIEGADVEMEISNVDRTEKTVAETVMNSIEQIELRGLKPQITGAPSNPAVYYYNMGPGFPATIRIELTDALLYLQRIRMRLRTYPFQAISTAAEGGDHYHKMFDYRSAGGTTQTNLYAVSTDEFGAETEEYMALGATLDMYTQGSSGTLSLVPVFGRVDDSETPTGMTIWFEGNDVTEVLTGAATLAPSGGNLDELLDVGALTNMILNATAGLRSVHEIELRCSSGQGVAEVSVEVFQTTQDIKYT